MVVARIDTPLIVEHTEHNIDFMALAVEDGIVGHGDLSAGFRGDAAIDSEKSGLIRRICASLSIQSSGIGTASPRLTRINIPNTMQAI